MAVVDPLIAIIKLGILHLKNSNAKISIQNNKIYIQDSWELQGLERWFNNDNRNDLNQLYYPILYFIGLKNGYIKSKLYISEDIYNTLNEYCIKGLIRLKKTYESINKSNTIISSFISTYIKMLKSTIDEESYTKEIKNINSVVFAIYNEYMNIWIIEEINLVCDIYQLSLNHKDNSIILNYYSKAIDNIVKSKDYELDYLRPI